MTCPLTIEEILVASKPEDLFGDLPKDKDDAKAQAAIVWKKCARLYHPDVNDDPRAGSAMSKINEMMGKVEHGKYGPHNVDVSIRTKRHRYKLIGMVAQGDACNIYNGEYVDDDGIEPVIVKIVRDRNDNDLLANEAKTLKLILGNKDTFDGISPYLPSYIETFGYKEEKSRPRQAIVFKRTPSLYTLAQVRDAYPHGVHAKDAAWMFRRLLYALALTHENGIVHGAVTPDHILIQPEQHGLVLLDWKYAVELGGTITAIPTGAKEMYPADVLDKKPSTFGIDIFMAARCMAYVMGGSPYTGALPDHQPRQIQAFLNGTSIARSSRRPQSADEIRMEYTELIEHLWGPRKFRPFCV